MFSPSVCQRFAGATSVMYLALLLVLNGPLLIPRTSAHPSFVKCLFWVTRNKEDTVIGKWWDMRSKWNDFPLQTPCKAKLSLSMIRIPLLWRAEDLKAKQEKSLAVFCLVKIGSQVRTKHFWWCWLALAGAQLHTRHLIRLSLLTSPMEIWYNLIYTRA